jgi:hypothetical protein
MYHEEGRVRGKGREGGELRTDETRTEWQKDRVERSRGTGKLITETSTKVRPSEGYN